MNWMNRSPRLSYDRWRRGVTSFQRPLAAAGGFEIIRDAKSSGPTQVMIYDEIGIWGISSKDFAKQLSDVKGPIEVHIDSPGGSAFEGIAIYNTLKQYKGTVSVVVDGLAASAASFIAQAASPGELAMASYSAFMIHDGETMMYGNAADFAKVTEELNRASDNIASIYAERSGKPAAEWRTAMQSETWYYDQEAVDAGLADKVLGDDTSDLSNKITKAPVEPSTESSAPESSSVVELEFDPEILRSALKGAMA